MIPLLVGPTGLSADPLKAWLVKHQELLRTRVQELVKIQDAIEQRVRLLMLQAAFDSWESIINPWASLA